MNKVFWPTVSIITPTLNSIRTLKLYFEAIQNQLYKGKLEVLILDGGSTDGTLEMARECKAKIFQNKLKTGEAGKALGVENARGEILLFIDSDNILTNKHWIEKLISPLVADSQLLASETIKFEYRRKDFWLTRYFALVGVGDPINLFIGNYDRYSYVTDKWTGLKIEAIKQNGYLKIKLQNKFPTIGANGFAIRKSVFSRYKLGEYLFDIDVLKSLAKKKPVYAAKVDMGIIHLFSGDVGTFIRKQRRRIRDYIYYKSIGKREKINEKKEIYIGVIKFVLYCVTIFPLFFQSIVGYKRKRDWVWIFHPLACYITLFAYTYEVIRSLFIKERYNRKSWRQ